MERFEDAQNETPEFSQSEKRVTARRLADAIAAYKQRFMSAEPPRSAEYAAIKAEHVLRELDDALRARRINPLDYEVWYHARGWTVPERKLAGFDTPGREIAEAVALAFA